jgi:hypothetical protein
MSEVSVKYNGNLISPPPFVSRTANPLDYGHRWGYEDGITLKGMYYVGSQSSGIVTGFANLFRGQFSRLVVESSGAGDVTVIDYPHVILEEISFDSNRFHPNTYVPYTVKLKNINVPSGVIDPTNEYQFTQNEDGTVSVSHKISARGVVTDSSFDSALQNAQNFVKQFSGMVPFSPVFVSYGSGILTNQSETIDRLNASYSISESYKYNSGEYLDYVYLHNLDIDSSVESDYPSLSFSCVRNGSSIKSNISALRSGVTGFNILSFLEQKYSIATGKLFLNSYNISEDPSRNSIQISANLLSGVGNEFSGFLDYDIDMKWDKVQDVRTFNINGKFYCTAPISQKRIFLENFKSGALTTNTSYQTYLYDIVTGSSVNVEFCSTNPPRLINPIPSNFSIQENTGLADLTLTATFSDQDFVDGIGETTFSVAVDAPKNLYEFKASANIEGNYVIQDLQSITRESVKLSANMKTLGDTSAGLTKTNALLSQLSETLLAGGFFIMESGINTGEFDVDANLSFLNGTSQFGLDTRHYYSQNPKSLRPKGYKFGL